MKMITYEKQMLLLGMGIIIVDNSDPYRKPSRGGG